MPRRSLVSLLLAAAMLALALPAPAAAETAPRSLAAASAYDLIDAVNALRGSHGLPPYGINSTLMYTAQNQADFMATTGTVTHSGPGGIGLTDRLLAAGYPLAGDLSLGGFRAENIISGGHDATAQWAVDQWMGDAPHQNTMLSPNLSEIGAGVATAGGRVYFVIDAAHPTTGGVPQTAVTLVGGGSAVPAGEAPVASSVVVISTPNTDGDVIHEVLAGQTLWQIAISYNVRIDEIKRLNNLPSDNIFPGEKLLIKMGNLTASETPAAAPTLTATEPPPATATSMPVASTAVPTFAHTPVAAAPASRSVMGAVIGILAVALLAGGLFTWLGPARKPGP